MICEKLEKKINSKKNFINFIPAELSWLTTVKSVEFNGVNLKTAYIIDILNTLITKHYFKGDSSSQLNSTILRERYGNKYNYYIDFLTQKKWLILVRDYFRGKNSRIFRLNKRFFKRIIRVENNDRVLIKKWKERYHLFQLKSDNSILNEVKLDLISDLYEVSIDGGGAVKWLESQSMESEAFDKNLYSIESIESGNIFYHFDSYGRFHTNFTILKSHIRKEFLRIGGEGVKEIDIQNSQPLVLSRIIPRDEVDGYEYDFFKKLVNGGDFYDYLSEQSNLNKSDVKKLVFHVLFGRNRNSEFDKIFKWHFPTIYKWIRGFKKKNSNYKSLAWKLQSIESDLIYNKIFKSVKVIYPDIPMITVHDCIIVKESDYQRVLKIFNHFLDKFKKI